MEQILTQILAWIQEWASKNPLTAFFSFIILIILFKNEIKNYFKNASERQDIQGILKMMNWEKRDTDPLLKRTINGGTDRINLLLYKTLEMDDRLKELSNKVKDHIEIEEKWRDKIEKKLNL